MGAVVSYSWCGIMMHLLLEFDFIIGQAQKYSPLEVDNIYDSDLNVTQINPDMTVLSTVTS